MNNIGCVIFDLDGVIVSTDEYHYKAWKSLAEEYSLPFNRRINEKLRGVSRMESLEIILQGTNRVFTPDEKREMTDKKNNYYVESLDGLSDNDILPGALMALEELRMRKIKVAIGSSSKNARRILMQIKLIDSFDFVADGTQITQSKPHPEVFLLVANQLGIEPERCLVIEDAESGVEAAKRGNMKVMAVGKNINIPGADYYLNDLTEIDWD